MIEARINVYDKTSYIAQIAEKLSFPIEDLKLTVHPKDFCHASFVLCRGHNTVASFILSELVGCCGVVVSTTTYVGSNHRNKGVGAILNAMRQQIAFHWNYGLIICTDVETNTPQRKILKKNNWIESVRFINPKTCHSVLLHHKLVQDTRINLGFSASGDYLKALPDSCK